MHKKKLNISEATLWDNLKRKANETLRKIDSEKDGAKRLKFFDPKKSRIIEGLLEDIGKEFFKIFLFKHANTNKNFKDFKFYFWPGFTTLNGKRIFVNGTKKGKGVEDRFFTGIGNKEFQIKNYETLGNYLSQLDSGPNLALKFDGDFWVKDIPSTVSFDKVLNQYYIDKYDLRFITPSTHHWKSNQKRVNNEFIPMPLKSDGSEFRILSVSLDSSQSLNNGNNEISVTIKTSELGKSGYILSEYLSKNLIPINWYSPDDKKAYIPWPYHVIRNEELPQLESFDSIDLKILAYTFWISETLNNPKNPVIPYDQIRNKFIDSGNKEIADTIESFKVYLKKFTGNKNRFAPYYYNNWYTLFLESYGEEVDLGTAMFLTSEKYEADFLMKCANWLRWIYNELRILEATAKEELRTEDSILKLLKHTQKHYLNALEISLSKSDTLDKVSELSTSILKGHYYILDILSVSSDNNEKNRLEEPIELSITNTLNGHIDILKSIIHEDNFSAIIKNIHPSEKERYSTIVCGLLNDCKVSKEFNVLTYQNILTIILKELMVNAIENIDLDNPHLSIDITATGKVTSIEIGNSVSDFALKKIKKNYEAFKNKSRISKRFGWWVICRLSELAGYQIEICELDEINLENIFKIKISVKNEEEY